MKNHRLPLALALFATSATLHAAADPVPLVQVTDVGLPAPLTPRIGERIRLDFSRLDFPIASTMRISGKLPPGLRFDPATQRLQGRLIGQPGSYSPRLQIFRGRTYVRSVPIPIHVQPFPKGLADGYEGLLVGNGQSVTGVVDVKIKPPGKGALAEPTWTATLDGAGDTLPRTISGAVTLNSGEDATELEISFPAEGGKTALGVSMRVKAGAPLVDGRYFTRKAGQDGTVSGFRLAPKAMADGPFNVIIDQGEFDGFSVPAGLGWATGSSIRPGEITLEGRLGDAQAFKTTAKLSVTGQAILWVKPYRDQNSSLGGIISLRESGLVATRTDEYQPNGLSWFRASDASELSYPAGFGPIRANVGIKGYSVPKSARAFTKALGLDQWSSNRVIVAGAGLPDPSGKNVPPLAFIFGDHFELIAQPLLGGTQLPWTGAIAKDHGTFSGTLKLPASRPFGIAAGDAAVSGIFTPGAAFEGGAVGAGFVKVPVTDKKAAFRTAAIIISKDIP